MRLRSTVAATVLLITATPAAAQAYGGYGAKEYADALPGTSISSSSTTRQGPWR